MRTSPGEEFLEKLKSASPQEKEAMTADVVAGILSGQFRRTMPGLEPPKVSRDEKRRVEKQKAASCVLCRNRLAARERRRGGPR
jgi:hypothetical protein